MTYPASWFSNLKNFLNKRGLTPVISFWGVWGIFNFTLGKKSADDKKQGEDSANIIESLRHAFKKVKSELDQHLSDINENSDDIQELSETFSQLESRIDKLTERLDEMELVLNPKFKNMNYTLSKHEQEVFMALYVGRRLTLGQIAKRIGFTTDMVNNYLINIIGKGVPIQKEIVEDLLVFSIDPDFRDMQARRNILNIDPRVSKQVVEFDLEQ